MASLVNAGTRSDPRWRIRYRNKGDRNPRSWTLPVGTPRREAERMVREVQFAIDRDGSWNRAEAPPVDLDGAIEQYLAARARPTRRGRAASAATRRLYTTVLRKRFLPFTERRGGVGGLFALEKGIVARFLDSMAEEGRPETTIYTYGATIRTFWRWAHRRWPEQVGAPEVDVQPPVPRAVHAPTIEEVDRMIAALTAPVKGRNRFPRAVFRAVVVMRYTGLRISQAGGLRWGDLVEDHEMLGPALRIRPDNCKNRAEAALDRRIPLAAPFFDALLAWRDADGPPGKRAPVVGPGLPRDPAATVNGAWSRAGVREHKWAGRPDHALRRAMITFLLGEGVPEPAVDWFVGHAGRSINARHYTAPTSAWWPLLIPALAALPPLDVPLDA